MGRYFTHRESISAGATTNKNSAVEISGSVALNKPVEDPCLRAVE